MTAAVDRPGDRRRTRTVGVLWSSATGVDGDDVSEVPGREGDNGDARLDTAERKTVSELSGDSRSCVERRTEWRRRR